MGTTHSPAPATGCQQSTEVTLAREGDRLVWEWQGSLEASSSGATVLVYDGAATAQGELAAPSPGVDSLLATVSVELHGRAGRLCATGAMPSLGAVDPARLVSQLRLADGIVLGRAVSVDLQDLELPPIPESGSGLLDESLGRAEIDRLAAQYNGRWSGGGPLDMAAFLCAIAQTELQDHALRTDVEDLDIPAMLSASYLAGWFSGRWFAENGYQWPAPETLDLAPAEAAIAAMRQGVNAATRLEDDDVLAFLTHESAERERGYLGGTGLVSLVSIVGYNLGYCLTVNEETADGTLAVPPLDLLTAEGEHPPLTSPDGPKPDGVLLGCHFSPTYLTVLENLRGHRDTFDAAFPDRSARLKTVQDDEELRGRRVWTYQLGNAIKADQNVRRTVWALNNSFLSGTVGAALANMGAQVNQDVALARRAAFVGSSLLKGGTLWAYSLGVGSPAPRDIPKWDLGTTPLREH
jgi:hypothetical protein